MFQFLLPLHSWVHSAVSHVTWPVPGSHRVYSTCPTSVSMTPIFTLTPRRISTSTRKLTIPASSRREPDTLWPRSWLENGTLFTCVQNVLYCKHKQSFMLTYSENYCKHLYSKKCYINKCYFKVFNGNIYWL